MIINLIFNLIDVYPHAPLHYTYLDPTCNKYSAVCTKTPHFPYILLPTQEVRVYFVAMITLGHVLVRESSMYAHL